MAVAGSQWLRRIAAASAACWQALPGDCALCGARARCGKLCPGCLDDVLATMHAAQRRCGRCALRLRACAASCPDCERRPLALARVVAGFDYESPGDMLIARYKTEMRYALAGVLADLVMQAQAASGALPPGAVLVPIPASRVSLRRRGFNPAGELARALARRTGLPLRRNWLARTREGPRQAALTRAGRMQGATGGYTCTVRLPSCPVVLVDDVMTTGSTLHAAALAVRAAGAGEVIALVAARAPANDGGTLAQYRLP